MIYSQSELKPLCLSQLRLLHTQTPFLAVTKPAGFGQSHLQGNRKFPPISTCCGFCTEGASKQRWFQEQISNVVFMSKNLLYLGTGNSLGNATCDQANDARSKGSHVLEIISISKWNTSASIPPSFKIFILHLKCNFFEARLPICSK